MKLREGSLFCTAAMCSIVCVSSQRYAQAQGTTQKTIVSQNSAQAAVLVNAWQTYFRSLRSLQFAFTDVIDKHPLKGIAGTKFTCTFALNGSRYRLDNKFPAGYTEQSYQVRAFDGKFHQSLMALRTGTTTLLFDRQPIENIVYGTSIPLLDAFDWAFGADDPRSIEFLQRPATWRLISQRISKVEKGERQGKPGYFVTLKGKDKGKIYKIFAAESNYFPLYLQATQVLKLKKGPVKEVVEGEVLSTMTWKSGNRNFLFPLKNSGHVTRDGNLYIVGHAQVIGTPKINVPIPNPTIFTLPRSQVSEVIDRAAQNKIGKAAIEQQKKDAEKNPVGGKQ